MKINVIKAGIIFIVFAAVQGPVNILAEDEKPPAPGAGTTLSPGEGTTVAVADQEKEEWPTLSGDVAFLSQYIWRGYELSKDSLVIQPSVTAAYKGFSINLWGNFDTDAYAGPNEGNYSWNETDFTFGYERSFGPLGIGAGYIYYAVDYAEDTQEFYLSVGGDVILAPTLFEIFYCRTDDSLVLSPGQGSRQYAQGNRPDQQRISPLRRGHPLHVVLTPPVSIFGKRGLGEIFHQFD